MEATVIKSGKTSDDRNWALLETEKSGFTLTGFVKPNKPMKEGDKINLPSEIADAVKWNA